MKLELDINSTKNSLLDNHSNNSKASDALTEEVKKTLRSGINLAKEGKRAEARQMLLKVTEIEPENETAWLWLASISEYPEELLVFLQNVLKVNPENKRALEWAKQTKTLLSKTFVQRGINASHDNQKEFAKQCFLQGIVHDDQNEMAWLWLASTSDSQEEKLSHLQKVLQINPDNETALSSLNAVRNQMSQSLLKKASSAAISGDRGASKQMLETIMRQTPHLEEAWILKAYLADEYYEKIESYQKALEINPQSEAAQAGLASLQALAQKASKVVSEVAQPVVEEKVTIFEEALSEVENEEYDPKGEELQEVVEEIGQSAQELASEIESEEVDQPVELAEEPEVKAEQFVSENSFVSEFETESQEVLGEVNQTEVSDEIVAAGVEEERSVEETESEQPQTEELIVEEEVAADENSPTQELDEEFARTADAVFNSYQQSEDFQPETEDNTEDNSLELQPELQEFEDETEVVEEHAAEQTEEKEAEVEAAGSELVLTDESSAETSEDEQNQEVERNSSDLYQSPYQNGFEMVSASEPFADYQQPTVEFSSSELAELSVPANEYFEPDDKKEVSVIEPSVTASVQLIQPQTEPYTNGFAADSNSEVAVSEVAVAAEVKEIVEEVAEAVQPQLVACPFCEFENESQNIICNSCQAMISLSDLEMLLAHQDANQDLLLTSIERMEVEKTLYEFGADDLTNLGVAYLNARNLRKGFSCLQEASQLNPNDVVLASKVNFLAIRLNEIEKHDQKAQENPVQSRTILVVDDSPTVRKLISGKLEKSGHSVVSAIDGMDALAKINEVIPDLILLDITMPRLDGYQVCKLIRNNPVTKDIPIVMISGKDGFFDKVRGRMAGSSGYITKPFGPDTLMKTIETYLG